MSTDRRPLPVPPGALEAFEKSKLNLRELLTDPGILDRTSIALGFFIAGWHAGLEVEGPVKLRRPGLGEYAPYADGVRYPSAEFVLSREELEICLAALHLHLTTTTARDRQAGIEAARACYRLFREFWLAVYGNGEEVGRDS